jgi:hypothetical protein
MSRSAALRVTDSPSPSSPPSVRPQPQQAPTFAGSLQQQPELGRTLLPSARTLVLCFHSTSAALPRQVFRRRVLVSDRRPPKRSIVPLLHLQCRWTQPRRERSTSKLALHLLVSVKIVVLGHASCKQAITFVVQFRTTRACRFSHQIPIQAGWSPPSV